MIRFLLICMATAFVQVSTAQGKYDFVVDKSGKGDFLTIQEAIDAVPDFRKNTTTIFVRNGIYKEKVVVAGSKTNVRMIGEDNIKTVLTFDDFASKKNRFGEEMGTTGSSTIFVFGDGFQAENMTFENSAGPVGQAVAMRIDGDKVSFANCRFLGNQDTLYPHGENSRQLYKNCYIEGTVDFIFGWSTAFFESCVIYCKKGGGYITAAATMKDSRHGFVFSNCRITGDAETSTFYLGRPWRPNAKTVFINCFLDKQIKPEGWHNWGKPEAESTTFYAEFGSSGPGAKQAERVKWARRLTKEEADQYTIENVLGNWKENVPK